ncbi:hypothetical protein [Pseudomonas sp. yb_1]
MTFCLFMTARNRIPGFCLGVTDIQEHLAVIPGMTHALCHQPLDLPEADPFIASKAAPSCVLQLYFGTIDHVESALHTQGNLGTFVHVSSMAGYQWEQQVMLVRRFSDNLPKRALPTSEEQVTYLVHYTGRVADEAHWIERYVHQHPSLLARLPGVRNVEVYTRLDYCSQLPVARSQALQRNKVVFDSVHTLRDALNSPQRETLRQDFLSLPRFEGESPHYPMRTFEC